MYPLFLKLENKPCLVIGGGKIAERKTASLLEAGASITLISPNVTDQLANQVKNKEMKYINRLYKSGDGQGYFLIIAATNSRECNKQVYEEANQQNSLINCVDDPDFCNFYVPALVKRGNLKIAISTEGKLPMLSGKIRKFLNSLFPEDMGEKLDELGQQRIDLISEAGDDEDKKMILIHEQLTPSIDNILEGIEK